PHSEQRPLTLPPKLQPHRGQCPGGVRWRYYHSLLLLSALLVESRNLRRRIRSLGERISSIFLANSRGKTARGQRSTSAAVPGRMSSAILFLGPTHTTSWFGLPVTSRGPQLLGIKALSAFTFAGPPLWFPGCAGNKRMKFRGRST